MISGIGKKSFLNFGAIQNSLKKNEKFLIYFIISVGPLLAFMTFLQFKILPNEGSKLFENILIFDLSYIILVALFLGYRVMSLIRDLKMNTAGSKLHSRLLIFTALIALTPTIFIAVFATISLNFGLETWFSDRVHGVVTNSFRAADAYKVEHIHDLFSDTESLAKKIDSSAIGLFSRYSGNLRELLNISQNSTLSEAFLIDNSGEIQERGIQSYRFYFEKPNESHMKKARSNEEVLILDPENGEIRTIYQLKNFSNRFLYTSRKVDGKIFKLLDETLETVNLYKEVETQRGRILFEFSLIYLAFSVVIILSALWMSLIFIDKLIKPIGELALAASRIGSGDFSVKVNPGNNNDEIGMLGQTFNSMTERLRGQRSNLLKINSEIEARKNLFETVISGVSGGIIGLTKKGIIEVINPAGIKILRISEENIIGKNLSTIVPEFSDLFKKFLKSNSKFLSENIVMSRRADFENILFKITARFDNGNKLLGYVINFDNMTDLVAAQRSSAWGEIAKRIAHEIKNPLTPIKLSAERLKGKFQQDSNIKIEELTQYSDMIIRQTESLENIVEEFSKFARMPKINKVRSNFSEILEQTLSLEKVAHTEISYFLKIPKRKFFCFCDPNLMSQAIINILKNSAESIQLRQADPLRKVASPSIHVFLQRSGEYLSIKVQDNGLGLPRNKSKLVEPYVSNKAKGTGLGLAIVKKALSDHEGHINFNDIIDAENKEILGAEVVLLLPYLK